jgi:ribonucleotide reductase alpha subunit
MDLITASGVPPSPQTYSYQEALEKSKQYFNGDELAASVFINKYALRDNSNNLLEDSPVMMHTRIAKEFARIESKKFKEPLKEEEIFGLLDHFKYIIPAGSPMFGIGNDFQVISLSNCYLADIPLDCYSSIMDIDKQLVNISKRRGGVGVDLSELRPNGSPTHNAARSATGIVTWMERYSHSIREVGQLNRRGALMLTLSIHHPDIIDFCTIKNDKGKVTGANISVRLTKEFLDAVKEDKEYELRFPIDYKEKNIKPMISKLVKAREIWDIIITSVLNSAEPGLLMWDNVTLNTPADYYENYKSRGTNPCCFARSSTVWVITNRGYKEIKSITSDDLIWIDTKGEWAKTSGYFDAGIANVYQVIFSNGIGLYITDNHKLMRDGKLVKLKNLHIGDGVWTNKYDPIIRQFNHVSHSYVTIKSIDLVGKERVGCIEVENHHQFTANGIISGNSEINLSPLDSCRLLSMNLYSYVDKPFSKDAGFDFSLFKKHAKLAQRLMDDLVDLESEKITKIIKKIDSDPEPEQVKSPEKDMWLRIKRFNDEGRRTGTGITALGDTFAALGIKYGSKESIDLTEKIYRKLKLSCYESSIDMAEELGSFKDFDFEKEKKCPFLQQIYKEKPELRDRMKKSGRRNIALTTTAPTGTLSLLTQTTSGIEPLFQTSYVRRRKINPFDVDVRVDFIDKTGDKWQEYEVLHPKINEWMRVIGEKDVKKSPWYNCCAEDLDWVNRINLQAAAAQHVCHSISSTINLPEDVTKETISKIYEMAFNSCCKGITVYRKNCRSGVLIDKPSQGSPVRTATKRPKELPGEIFALSYKKERLYVATGFLEGGVYEIFTGVNFRHKIEKAVGKIVKISRGTYKFICENGDEIELTNGHSNDEADALSRILSCSMRHKVDLSFLVQQLEKTQGELTSFSKVIARVLKKYIKDGTPVSGEECPECRGKLIRANGCKICSVCGNSTCQ